MIVRKFSINCFAVSVFLSAFFNRSLSFLEWSLNLFRSLDNSRYRSRLKDVSFFSLSVYAIEPFTSMLKPSNVAILYCVLTSTALSSFEPRPGPVTSTSCASSAKVPPALGSCPSNLPSVREKIAGLVRPVGTYNCLSEANI